MIFTLLTNKMCKKNFSVTLYISNLYLCRNDQQSSKQRVAGVGKSKSKKKPGASKKGIINQLNPNSQRGFKKRLQPKFTSSLTSSALSHKKGMMTSSLSRKKGPSTSRSNFATTSSNSKLSNTKQKKLLKQFRGAKADTIKKLSTGRLAAYGLDKRKKKNETS